MKLNKIFVLVVVLTAFAVIMAGLYSFYSQRVSQRNALLNSQKANQRTLSKLDEEKRILQSRLPELESSFKDAQTKLAETKRSFPVSVESIEYGEEIAKLALESKLNLVSISAKATTEENINGATYLVSRIDAEVKGEVDKILSFVDSVSMGASFRSTSMQTLEVTDMDKPESVAHLFITIYGLKGS